MPPSIPGTAAAPPNMEEADAHGIVSVCWGNKRSTKYHRLWLKKQRFIFFLTFLEAEVPDQGATSMVSSEASLLGLWVATFSPCLHLVVPLSAC